MIDADLSLGTLRCIRLRGKSVKINVTLHSLYSLVGEIICDDMSTVSKYQSHTQSEVDSMLLLYQRYLLGVPY